MRNDALKKQDQLGMNPSTAQHRLVKDILYKLVVATNQNDCFICGSPMSRDTFSIEHKEAWLDSEDPVKNFFDLENISFSHLACNVAAARKPLKKYDTPEAAKEAKKIQQKRYRTANPPAYCPEKRRARYKAKGY